MLIIISQFRQDKNTGIKYEHQPKIIPSHDQETKQKQFIKNVISINYKNQENEA